MRSQDWTRLGITPITGSPIEGSACPRSADFVAEVAEEIGVSRGDDYSNVGAALCGRSLQLERRL